MSTYISQQMRAINQGKILGESSRNSKIVVYQIQTPQLCYQLNFVHGQHSCLGMRKLQISVWRWYTLKQPEPQEVTIYYSML